MVRLFPATNLLPYGQDDAVENVRFVWREIRTPLVIPVIRMAVWICGVMSVMLFVERVYMAVVIVCVKLLGKQRYTKYKLDAVREDLEMNGSYPVVLVQIPMFNEKEVYRLSIGAACGLSWPSDKIIIQVLDDSTDRITRDLVEMECSKWMRKGVNIKYETRNNRNGYKAGAMRDGLKKNYVKDLNSDECLMTRLQEMSLDYHFSVEQEVGSSMYSFFGFNGTAGVWRMQALTDAGGWKERTTVEDMDLAVRASLRGWKFVFVGDLSVKNELPSTFKAYRYQQHRWSCGPANLFRKMIKEIILCEKVSMWKKFHVVYAFFFVRKIVAHLVTFFFYCIVIPLSVLVPQINLPKFVAIYIPSTITILNAVCTPRSLHLVVFWILFENVMSLHRTKAAIIGLIEAERVNEWVVTEKLGNTAKQKAVIKLSNKARTRTGERVHTLEILMGIFLSYCAIYDLLFGHDHFYIYLSLQATAFFIIGFGYVGTLVSN
ncbi:unnamed protein product [Victoria cruziana]